MFDKEEFQKAKEYYQKEYEEANIKEKEELK